MLSKEKAEEYARKIEPLYSRDDYGQKKPTVTKTIKRHGWPLEVEEVVLE
tara:strand:- start:223 stop:372 length:150 start_codon:yes stop_codon:yes gene_type:complete